METKCNSNAKYDSLSLYDDRELVLIKLNEAIDYLHKKGIKGKYQNKENEKLRIQYLKALAYTCNVYSSIKKGY